MLISFLEYLLVEFERVFVWPQSPIVQRSVDLAEEQAQSTG